MSCRLPRIFIVLVACCSVMFLFVPRAVYAAAENEAGGAQVSDMHGAADAGPGHMEEAAHQAGHEEHGRFGVTHTQLMNFIWHCLNFTLLVIILVKFLKKPIADALNGRTESIRAAFDELAAQKAEAERRYAEYERKLSGMDAEADRILKSFMEQGQAEKEKIIAQAKETAERIKAQAEFYIQQELDKAKAELREEVADMAVKMAEELVKKNLTEQDHHKLISEYLERVVQKN